ncbi:MAG TPA: methyl-accepting chemotaxis protein [Anaerolineae bacterium]|nr:methyl-accepting chemotaxis protein [Anaerolineae bacterium]
MREIFRQVARSGLLRRVLPLILLVSILPLFILAALNWISINGIHYDGVLLNPRQVEAGEAEPKRILTIPVHERGIEDLATEGSYVAVSEASLDALELRAVDLGKRVAAFMSEREQDARALAAIPPSVEAYTGFYQTKRGPFWTPEGTTDLPLYKEIAFVDPSGQEVVRVVDGVPVAPGELRDVSRPENTTYRRETYFADGMALDKGQVYVERLMGWYVPKDVAYAGVENPDGQRYQGVVRFVTPVYRDGARAGILVLSLDWTHAMELVDHVVGSKEGYAVEPPSAEVYSYLVGDDGWTLGHARDYHIVGLDENGQYVPSINEADYKETQSKTGLMPANANEIGFLGLPHPWPGIAEQNREGVLSASIAGYLNSKGEKKSMAWATVPYYTPPFDTPAGFGWVGISIDRATFGEAPSRLGAEIDRFATDLNARIYAILVVLTIAAVALISYLIYRMVAQPVGNMVGVAQRIARGDLSPVELPAPARSGGLGARFSLNGGSHDEMVQLQEAHAQMVEQLRAIITRIRAAALHISSAAEQVRGTLHEQAGAANQSAAAVTETTATMEEMAIIAGQIADRSQRVVENASGTQQGAQAGALAVSDTVAKLDEVCAANESNLHEILALGRKSRRIGEVMELIDNITARTKLIAFNAALEAAAAGESGRRFSVVAMEVRRLADNVVESTEEIRQRIAEIQAATNALVLASEQESKRIAEGVSRGQEANQALTEILESAESTTMAAEQISLATQQQRTAVEQVVEAARSIQADSQAVARGSEEATQVIADLVTLAEELRDAVVEFELEEGPARPART